MATKWWFKTTDDVRRCTWYTCQECMVTGKNSTEAIEHKTSCSHYKQPMQPLDRPDVEWRCEW
jgi:hypothetical protein